MSKMPDTIVERNTVKNSERHSKMSKNTVKQDTASDSNEPQDFFSAPLEAHEEIPEGTHPARLIRYSEFFEIRGSEQFRKQGDPETHTAFNAIFAVRTPTGDCDIMEMLMHKPASFTLSKKSKVYQFISVLATPDEFDAKKNSLEKVRMNDLLGRPCVVIVEKNKKEFSTIKSVGRAMAKQDTPNDQECEELLKRPSRRQDEPF